MEENNEPKKESEIDYSKLQGFDILETLDDKKISDSYNEKFYESLDNLKFLSISIPKENKLFYNFQQNPNASITTSTQQCWVTYNDLKAEQDFCYSVIKSAYEQLTPVIEIVDHCDEGIQDEVKPIIEDLEKRLRKFLVEQQTKNFKLIKEISLFSININSLT